LRARVIVLTLMVAALAAALLSGGAVAAAAAADPIVGDWNVTYSAPATIAMTLANGVYTETAETPVEIGASTCALPVGTVLSTFTQTGPGTYSGQHGIWSTTNCALETPIGMTATLSGDGNTLTAALADNYATLVFTKIHPASPDPIVGGWNVTYGAAATVAMTLANGVYTETAKTTVLIPGTSCDEPPGTVLSTFSQTGPGTYAGVHGTWLDSCAFDMWVGMTLTLSSAGNTLTADLDGYGTLLFTKVPAVKEVSSPTITGTVKVGSRVTASPGRWNPPSGVKFTYQWLANGTRISGATSQGYLIAPALAGKKLSVLVTASASGYQPGTAGSAPKAVAKGAFVIKAKPRLRGTLDVGKTLTVTKGTWIPAPAIKIQWYANGRVIARATGLSLKLTKALKGKIISVTVTAASAGYTTATVTLKEAKKVQQAS